MNDISNARNPMGICAVSLILGVIGVTLDFAVDQRLIGMIVGAIGLMVGGYAINLANRPSPNKTMYLVLSGLGLFLSVLAFMMGLKGLVA